MERLCLASIILAVSISLVGCTNSDVAGNGNKNNTESSTQNGTESKVPNSNDGSKQNNNVNNNANNNTTSNITSNANISLDRAKEIALSHAGLTSSQVTFKRSELDFDNGIQKYEIEFYYNNMEYSYEIDASNGKILSYEHD